MGIANSGAFCIPAPTHKPADGLRPGTKRELLAKLGDSGGSVDRDAMVKVSSTETAVRSCFSSLMARAERCIILTFDFSLFPTP